MKNIGKKIWEKFKKMRWWAKLLIIFFLIAIILNVCCPNTMEQLAKESKEQKRIERQEKQREEKQQKQAETEEAERKKAEKLEEITNKKSTELVKDYRGHLSVESENIIEKIDRIKIKGNLWKNATYAAYSDEVIHDKDDNEYAYSFMATGEYEEKKTGKLRNFIILIGYKNAEALEKANGTCLYYLSEAGSNVNNLAEEDDTITKLLETLGE
ncbi:MAG: hypothetical protein Q4Q17_01280 [Tissierellia bacterium]|nr:hypothetical protein [Tissierellia bacterium]